MKSSVVLTLHGVVPDSARHIAGQDIFAAKYTVTRSVMQEIARLLEDRHSSTLEEFINCPGGDYSILTFDDGLLSDYTEVFPILLDKGLTATFFVTVDNVGKPGYMNQNQIIEMARHGMEIASHGLEHRYLVLLSESDASREIKESKDILQQILGRAVISFAPVGGHYLPWMTGFAHDCGYRAFATMVPGRTLISPSEGIHLFRRNHIQAHHDYSFISSLIRGDRKILLSNQMRYCLLALPKRLLGMQTYDRLKHILVGGEVN